MKNKEDYIAKIRLIVSEITVEPVLFLFSFAYFLFNTTLQDLVYTKVCFEKFKDYDFCASNKTAKHDKTDQSETSHWIMYNAIIYLTLSSFVTLYTGSWGDRLGRKIPLIIAPIGFIIGSIGSLLYSIYMADLPIWILLICSFFSGLGGGKLTIVAACNSYVSQMSSPESRISRLAILEAMLSFGAILGPLFSGFLTRNIGHYAVFIATTASTITCFLYVVIFIKNTEVNNGDKTYHILSLSHIKDSFVTCFRARPNTPNRLYIILCLVIIVTTFYLSGVIFAIMYLYLKDEPLLWSFTEYARWDSVKHLLTAINIAITLPILHSYFKFSESAIGIIGAASALVSSTMYGFSTNGVLIYIATIPGAIFIFDIISSRSIISKAVDADEKGKVFAVASILQYSTLSIAVVCANLIWPITRTFFRGFIYEAAAVLSVVSLVCIVFLHVHMRKSSGKAEDDKNSKEAEVSRL